MKLNKKKFISILVVFFISLQLLAQDTTRLDSTSFYRISTTAFGKAIVYAQRNVQLKKQGNYYAKTNQGEARFTLNKEFYIDGDLSSIDMKNGVELFAKYINGTKIYQQRSRLNFKVTEQVSVIKNGSDYLITKTKTNQQDSTIEVYRNNKPLLKEKYTNHVLVIKNDVKKKEVNLYGSDGKLWERHFNNVEEKYSYDGTVTFKKVFLKGRIEEYSKGKLVKLYELQKDKPGQNLYDITTYDEGGNVKEQISEKYATAMVAPEYEFFDLPEGEFEAYKEIADKKR